MLFAFCAMHPIEKQINPLASMPIDSNFSFGVPFICRCPAISRADREAINGKAAQFIGGKCRRIFFIHIIEGEYC